jgi:hypothetical protein
MPHLSVPPILIDGIGWKERATKNDPILSSGHNVVNLEIFLLKKTRKEM